MARGWESKSVEAQQSDAADANAPSRKRHLGPEELRREQKKSELMLSRSRVVQQLQASSNPPYTEILNLALTDLDRQLVDLSD